MCQVHTTPDIEHFLSFQIEYVETFVSHQKNLAIAEDHATNGSTEWVYNIYAQA